MGWRGLQVGSFLSAFGFRRKEKDENQSAKLKQHNTSKFWGKNSSHDTDHANLESGAVARSDGLVRAGWARMRGRRNYNEDQVHCKFARIEEEPEEGEIACMGVFDGHGGPKASEYVQEHLFENILASARFPEDVFKAIEDGFVKTDSMYTKIDSKMHHDDGCTATAALIIRSNLYLAHVGDSRAVLGTLRSDGSVTAMPLTEDHKPNEPRERTRIESHGGTVIFAGTWRLSGVLAISRAFGNRLLKRWVVAHPEIREDFLTERSKCLIVASDGLWDVFTNQEAVDAVSGFENPETAASELIQQAYDRGSFDNISCIVVMLDIPEANEQQEECGDIEDEGSVTSVRPPRRTHDTTRTLSKLNAGFFS
jgi:protein phosphatase 1L